MAEFTIRTLRRPSAPVHGTFFVPARPVPAAAVLLIGGSGGSEPSYAGEALARAGIAALSVAYFAQPGLPDQLRGIPLEYFFAALAILRDELPGAPLIPRLPPGLLPPDLTDQAPDRAARADAWPRAVEFLRQLGTGTVIRARRAGGRRDPSATRRPW